ncbi:hypothetical protein [Microbacterium sp.]|uniref:hypothetical protein n=1 Tax=Microbacterium sp. TaxID=51671 RepID=UPI003221EB81
MSIVLIVTAFVLLIAATVIYVKNRNTGPDGTNVGSTRRGLILLVFVGLALALASQLPVFRG